MKPGALRQRWSLARTVAVALLAVVIVLPLAAHVAIDCFARIEPPVVLDGRFPSETRDGIRRLGEGLVVHARHAHRLPRGQAGGDRRPARRAAPRSDGRERARRLGGFTEVVPFAPAAPCCSTSAACATATSRAFPDARRASSRQRRAGSTRSVRVEAPDLPAHGHPACALRHRARLRTVAAPRVHGVRRSAPSATADGHALFARAFDFEAADVFDRDKAVFVVHEDGKIPFASVAWPGFVGVVTGMNAEGVAVAVHGGRAREPSTTGMPVAFSLRETLGDRARHGRGHCDPRRSRVMVSHHRLRRRRDGPLRRRSSARPASPRTCAIVDGSVAARRDEPLRGPARRRSARRHGSPHDEHARAQGADRRARGAVAAEERDVGRARRDAARSRLRRRRTARSATGARSTPSSRRMASSPTSPRSSGCPRVRTFRDDS